jgi:YidC/Oxa1 family membrane protein insertase
MDKRSLLYLGLMTLTLFGVNQYYTYQYALQRKVYEEQLATYEATQERVEGIRVEEKTRPAEFTPSKQPTAEQLYVIEANDQQLVFSNIGGSLVEINLPFEDDAHPHRIVREIEADRTIAEENPAFAQYPAMAAKNGNGSTTEPRLGGYYPLLRRGAPPHLRAFNVVSEFPEVAELTYQVKAFSETSITFEAVQKHRRITKTFWLDTNKNASFIVNVDVKVEGDRRGLWLTSGVPEVEMVGGGAAPVLKVRETRGANSDVESLTLPSGTDTNTSRSPDWVATSNGFFGVIMDPLSGVDAGYRMQQVEGRTLPSRYVLIGQEHQKYPAEGLPGYQVLLPLSGAETSTFRIYAGPLAEEPLAAADHAYSDPSAGYNPDYLSSRSYHGFFGVISGPFAKVLLILMRLFHQLTNSWAAAIILLTAALRLMLYPLNSWSMRSTKRMQELGPQVTALQNRYKKDQKKAQIEVMNLYREKGVNPMMGCFPMLIQMPFLIGMFDLLKSSIELRGAVFIPGWIDNLTAPDVLFSWGAPIPVIGNEFHLLPILMGASMYLQQKISSPLPKTGELTESQQQQKLMGTIMPVMMTFLFYGFPSGLNIYFGSSMLLGVLQQWWINRSMDAKSPKKTTA